MSELSVKIKWSRQEAELLPGKYSSAHDVIYNERFKVVADTAPDWGGSPENTNPEQALAASLSSCHMMTFLALAAKMKWSVSSYVDKAVAHLGKNAEGKTCVDRIDLHPIVTFDQDFSASVDELAKMHDRAHRYCFVANSLHGSVEVNINK